jgi:hypothetical protein
MCNVWDVTQILPDVGLLTGKVTVFTPYSYAQLGHSVCLAGHCLPATDRESAVSAQPLTEVLQTLSQTVPI